VETASESPQLVQTRVRERLATAGRERLAAAAGVVVKADVEDYVHDESLVTKFRTKARSTFCEAWDSVEVFGSVDDSPTPCQNVPSVPSKHQLAAQRAKEQSTQNASQAKNLAQKGAEPDREPSPRFPRTGDACSDATPLAAAQSHEPDRELSPRFPTPRAERLAAAAVPEATPEATPESDDPDEPEVAVRQRSLNLNAREAALTPGEGSEKHSPVSRGLEFDLDGPADRPPEKSSPRPMKWQAFGGLWRCCTARPEDDM